MSTPTTSSTGTRATVHTNGGRPTEASAVDRATTPASVDPTDPTDPAALPATASPPRMRAIVQEAYGSADVLHPGMVERPSITDREVLVQVRAAGLDRGTWHLMAGLPYAVR